MPESDQTSSSPPLPESAGTDGRARLLAALRRPGGRGQLVVAALLAVLGFGTVVQVQSAERSDRFAGATQQDLIQLINSLELASERARRQISELEQTKRALGDDTEASSIALERAREQIRDLGILAGTIAVQGKGVRVTVSGPPGVVGAQQLLNGLEELRDAGSEVVEINDTVRVIAQTSLSDGPEGTVIIDGARLSPPFVIEAIGNPDALVPAVFFPEGFADDVRLVGGKVDVERLDDVRIETTRTAQDPEFAEPRNR